MFPHVHLQPPPPMSGIALKDYIGYEPILAPQITIKFLGNSWNIFEV